MKTITELLTEMTLYSASLLAAAALPALSSIVRDKFEPTETSSSKTDTSCAILERSVRSDFQLAECIVEYYRVEREHFLRVAESRRDFLSNELVTINTKANIALHTAEQTEKLLLQNQGRLADCIKRQKKITDTRRALESLMAKLDTTLAKEQRINARRSESLTSIKTALHELKTRLIPEAEREQERIRQSFKKALAELYSVTSDNTYQAGDVDDARVDEIIFDLVSRKTSLEQFNEDLRRHFPNGIRRTFKKEKERRPPGGSGRY